MTNIYTSRHELDNYQNDYWGLPIQVPSVVFKTRVRDESLGGDNPYRWQDITTFDIFARKRVVLFSLPGAFTPTCSTFQLPDFERLAQEFYSRGIDDIYCVSVNDSFVMNQWAKHNELQNVKVIPDGNAEFTRGMHMDVEKENLGFGVRSWRYACIVDNGRITSWFIEEGKENNHEQDPYLYSAPQYILERI